MSPAESSGPSRLATTKPPITSTAAAATAVSACITRAWRRRSSDATLAGGVGGSGSAAVTRNSSNVASAAANCCFALLYGRGVHCGDRRRDGAQTLDLGQQNRVGLDTSALVGGGLAVEVGAGQLGVVGLLVVSHRSSLRAGEWS